MVDRYRVLSAQGFSKSEQEHRGTSDLAWKFIVYGQSDGLKVLERTG